MNKVIISKQQWQEVSQWLGMWEPDVPCATPMECGWTTSEEQLCVMCGATALPKDFEDHTIPAPNPDEALTQIQTIESMNTKGYSIMFSMMAGAVGFVVVYGKFERPEDEGELLQADNVIEAALKTYLWEKSHAKQN